MKLLKITVAFLFSFGFAYLFLKHISPLGMKTEAEKAAMLLSLGTGIFSLIVSEIKKKK